MTSRVVLGYALIVMGPSVVVLNVRLARWMGPSQRTGGLARVGMSWLCVLGGVIMTLTGVALLVQPI